MCVCEFVCVCAQVCVVHVYEFFVSFAGISTTIKNMCGLDGEGAKPEKPRPSSQLFSVLC